MFLIQDVPPPPPVIRDLVCTNFMSGTDPLTEACSVIIVRGNDGGQAISFYVKVGQTELDVRFFGRETVGGMTIDAFSSGDRTPSRISKPGACLIRPEQIQCSMSIADGRSIRILAQ